MMIKIEVQGEKVCTISANFGFLTLKRQICTNTPPKFTNSPKQGGEEPVILR